MCASHFVIDFIKFFIKPIYYSPDESKKSEDGGKHLLKTDIRYFADQFLHLLAIALIAIFFLNSNADISMNKNIVYALNADSKTLIILFKALAAFIVVLQPVSLTFYKIFDIEVLAQSKTPESKDEEKSKNVDIKGAGAIIGFMERIIMLCLLIMGEYTAIGFVIAGKSLIRLNSNIKQEFFIIGTFYGIITTIVTFIIFFKL